MRSYEPRLLAGILLIVLGVIFLLQTLAIIPSDLEYLWALIFGVAGLAFLYAFSRDRARAWWAAIPGFTLLGLAGVILVGTLGSRDVQPLGGALFLGTIGVSFLAVYASNRDFWWAIIPAGTLFTLALIAGLSNTFEGEVMGSVFFFGLAATFAVLSLVPTQKGRMTWALIPAAILAIMGVLAFATMSRYAGYLWPVALILVGLYLLLRRQGPKQA